MNINPNYLDMPLEKAGIRNSQKRLKQLIVDYAIEPLKEYQDDFLHKLNLVEEIVTRRVAKVIIYWLQHKDDPKNPQSSDLMSSITNASKNDVTLEEFYLDQVKNGIYNLAPLFALELPAPYEIETEELEYALIELEDRFEEMAALDEEYEDYDSYQDYSDYVFTEDPYDEYYGSNRKQEEAAILADLVTEDKKFERKVAAQQQAAARQTSESQPEKAIVLSKQDQRIERVPEQQIDINVLNITSERAWQLTYDLIGYNTEYIQAQMLPRWTHNPDTFEKDRRFLYQTFLDTIRNAAGVQMVAGNSRFSDRPMTIDQLWNYYFTDLSRNVGPLLSAARLDAAVNDPWYIRWWKFVTTEGRKISPVWILALAVALVFDGLTTFVSLDQTPMEGFMVWVFTILITILFQIADILVINYRRREFEADAMAAKYNAQFQKHTNTIANLDTTSESFVQMSMHKSKALADWKAAEDSRKMARRGRFWSARIADINIIVTAYGFAFMFLNAEEPMFALYQQIQVMRFGMWESLNLWVFLMIGLAITVSFVINTAQRTEILGWSLRRLKNEG